MESEEELEAPATFNIFNFIHIEPTEYFHYETTTLEPENDTFTYTNSSNSTNTTLTRSGVPPEFLQMSQNSRNCVIAYAFLFIIAATGNFSVFFSVLQQQRRTKSRISVFILHLSLADLLVTFGVIPLEVIWRITVQWYGGTFLCKFCKFFSAFGLYLSSFVLICISLDRYFAIIHPLRVTDARRRGKIMLFSAWIMATVCSLPQVFIFHVESHPIYPSFQQCVALGFFSSRSEELIYNVFSVSFMYFVPLAIVIFTYVRIICKITRKSRQHSESRKSESVGGGRILLRRSDASNHMERARNRTLKLTIVIVIVFIICWSPYVVITLWYMLDRESAQKIDVKIQDALFIMVVSNSCLNPLVYGTYTRECRESMTSCCGYSARHHQESQRRDFRSRRRNEGGCGSGGGLRRQSQLKLIYTSTKRSTSKNPVQSQPLKKPLNAPPFRETLVFKEESPLPLSSPRTGYSINSSIRTTNMDNPHRNPHHSNQAKQNPGVYVPHSILKNRTENNYIPGSTNGNSPPASNNGPSSGYSIRISPDTVLCKIGNSKANCVPVL